MPRVWLKGNDVDIARRTVIQVAACAAIASLPVVGHAQASYSAGANTNFGVDSAIGSAPVSASAFGSTTQTDTFPWNSTAQASASAGSGTLSAYSSSSLNLVGWFYGAPYTASAGASFSFNDIVISGPGPIVPTSINLEINGTLSATSGPLYPSNALPAQAFATVDFSYGGSFGSGSGSSMVFTDGVANGSVTTVTNSGMFGSGFSGTQNLTTATVDVLTGQMLSFSAQLHTGAYVSAQFGAQPIDLQAISDFSHTLMFGSGVVFNLPDGYTVNSGDGLIVNNHWAGATVTAVPEPETYAMLLAGLGGLGWRMRRRKSESRRRI